ncbi:MAG: hypothetical protein JWM21_925 [Acidobacteria bacterium]|nr:hypothetical protein [Acidobacteriota bacterium]
MNENKIVNETSPDEVWKAVDDETRESVIRMFLYLAFEFVMSQAVQVRADDDEEFPRKIRKCDG